MQAKVADEPTGTYPHLHYKGKEQADFQSDVLIAAARNSFPPRIPIYLLYTHPSLFVSAPLPFEVDGAGRELLSCAIAPAEEVPRLRVAGGSRHVNDLAPRMRPWHGLVCNTRPGSGDLAQRAREWLLGEADPGNTRVETARKSAALESEGADIVPDYVSALAYGDSAAIPDDLAYVAVLLESE